MNKTSVLTILGLLWFAVPPVCAIGSKVIMDRWLLQETSGNYWAMLLIAALMLASGTGMLLWLRLPIFPNYIVLLLAWPTLGGSFGGPLALDLVNRIGFESAGQQVQLESVEQLRLTVRLRPVGHSFEGITLTGSNAAWRAAYKRHDGPGKSRPALLRRGRLGLWWGELT